MWMDDYVNYENRILMKVEDAMKKNAYSPNLVCQKNTLQLETCVDEAEKLAKTIEDCAWEAQKLIGELRRIREKVNFDE